jgi:hypothetical protein
MQLIGVLVIRHRKRRSDDYSSGDPLLDMDAKTSYVLYTVGCMSESLKKVSSVQLLQGNIR